MRNSPILLNVLLVALLVMASSFSLAQTTAPDDQRVEFGPIYGPGVLPPPLPALKAGHTQVVDIKLLSARPTADGGVQPFRVRDVREQIDPLRRIANTDITCPDNTRYPAAGMFAATIAMTFFSGRCGLTDGATRSQNVVFLVDRIGPASASITGKGGWTVNVATINGGGGTPLPNTVRITRNGITFSMVLNFEVDGSGGGNIFVTSFMRI